MSLFEAGICYKLFTQSAYAQNRIVTYFLLFLLKINVICDNSDICGNQKKKIVPFIFL